MPPPSGHLRALRAFAICAGVWALTVTALVILPTSAGAAWAYESQIGAQAQNGQMQYPGGMVVDSSGNYFVADTLNNRVQKFNSAGVFQFQFGGLGSGAGQLHQPTDVAVDSSGNIWVVDSYNHRVQQFDSSGDYVSAIGGTAGSAHGQFDDPYGIAIDGSDNVYVSDRNNCRVEKFDSASAYQQTFGTGCGSTNRKFNWPSGIVVKSDGSLYIADTGNHRIQQLDSSGAFVDKFGSSGSTNGKFSGPLDVELDASGNVYVADHWNARVQKFGPSASSHPFTSVIGAPYGTGPDSLYEVTAVDVDAAGAVSALDASKDKILKFDSSGTFVSRFGSSGTSELGYASQIARAADGTLYVTDGSNDRVTHFSTTGAVLHTWGGTGSGNGQFQTATGIALATNGDVFVVDSGNGRVQRFTPTGGYISQFGSVGSGDGEFDHAAGLAVASDGSIYVMDSWNGRVQKFTSGGAYVMQFGTIGSGNGQFRSPLDIAIAADGSFFVADTGNHRIQKFNSSGVYQSQFGTLGTALGQFGDPSGVSISADGSLFVSDANNNNVTRVDAAGVAQEQIGAPVSDGETTGFAGAMDVITTANNAFWVPEVINNRIVYWHDGATTFDVSGHAFRSEADATPWQACDGITPNVKLSLDGAAPIATTCDRVTGAFSFTGVTRPEPGQVLVAWMASTVARGATYVVLAGGGGNVSLDVIQNRVTLNSEGESATIDRGTLQTYDQVDNSELPVDASTGSRISIANTTELHISDGVTFAPSSEMSVGSIHVEPTATFDVGSWQRINITGTGTEDDCTLGPRTSTPVCVESGGVVDASNSTTFTYMPTDTTRRVAISTDVNYFDLTIERPATFIAGTRAGQALAVENWFILNHGVTLLADPWHPDVSFKGSFYNDAVWKGSGAFSLNVESAMDSAGERARLHLPGADLVMNVTGNALLGSTWGQDWEFASMTFTGDRNNTVYGTAGSTAFDSGGADTPVAIVNSFDTWSSYAILNRPNGGTGQDWAILKYGLETGTIDAGWGTGGELTVPVGGSDAASSAVIGPDGNLYVGGSASGAWTVRAFNPSTGAAIPGFGTGGVWQPGVTGDITAMSLSPDRSTIFVAGDDAGGNWQIRQIDTTGTVVRSMSWNGDTGSGATQAHVTGICASPGWRNEVFVVGSVGGSGSRDWAIGKLVETAGVWGWTPFLDGSARPGKEAQPTGEDRATSCSDEGDRLMVGGTEGDGAAADVGKVRHYVANNGALDWTTTIDGAGQDYLEDVRVIDYRVYAVGGNSADGGTTTVHALDFDGRIDPSFSAGAGVAEWDAGTGTERGVALDELWGGLRVLSMKGTGSGDVAIQWINSVGQLQDTYSAGTALVRATGLLGAHIRVRGDVNIGDDDPTHKVQVDLASVMGSFVIDGALRVHTDGLLRSSHESPLVVGGDLSIAGPFWNEGGIVSLRPRTNQISVDVESDTEFEDFSIDSSLGAGRVIFDATDDLAVAGTFTATGSSCTDPLRLRPNGAGWTLNTTGGAVSGTYLDIANTTASPGRTVTNSWDSGSNSGVTFSGSCGAAGDLQAPDTQRVNGFERPSGIVDSPAPTLQWTNRTGTDVDTADIEVVSSSPSDMIGLWRFDGGGYLTDSSGNGHHLTDSASTQAAGAYGDAATTTAAQVGLNATTPYTLPSDYTVDGWFRRGPLTGSDVPFPLLILRGDGGGTQKSFQLVFDRDQNRLLAQLTKYGGTYYSALTDAAAYTDNQWHHVALTYEDDAGKLRLYLDGELMDTTRTGADPVDTGAWWTGFGGYLGGSMDDWEVRSVAMTPSEIRGYYRTKRAHVDTVWSTTNAAITSTADGAAASIPYGGAAGSLAHEGARYWARARFKTTPGAVWSSWSKRDWFETSVDQLTVSLPDGPMQSIGTLTVGADQHSEFRVGITTNSNAGWSLFARGEDDVYALSRGLDDPDQQIARRTTPMWNAGESGYAGLSVITAPGGKDTSRWGVGTDPDVYAGLRYVWPLASETTLIHSYGARNLAQQDVTLSARINASPTTYAGSYTGRLDFTVIPNA